MNIKDKVVIVTGASFGIGLETARLLSKKGAKVALAARSIDKLKKLSEELPNSYAVKTDMTKEEEIKYMVKEIKKHYGRIDILINNAGRGYNTPAESIDTTKFRELLELNLIGPLVAMQKVIPIMKKQGGGSIINISSGTALMFIPYIGAYSSTKRALVGLSLTARGELEKDNIMVSVVYPYITATNFYKNTIDSKPKSNDNRASRTNGLQEADSAEYVAEKILEAVEKEKSEVFAYDWMGKS